MITPAQMVRETSPQMDGSVRVRVHLVLKEDRSVPYVDVREHDLGGRVTGCPVVAAVRSAEDCIMRRLYGPAEHLWDVAAGLTAALKYVREKFLPEFRASEQLILQDGAAAEHTRPQWPPGYLDFRALLLGAGLAQGLRWSSAGDKFVPQTGGVGEDTITTNQTNS